MNLRLKRRRFGQLAIASAATTVLSNLAAKKTAAQQSLSIYGVRLTSASSSITEDMVDASAANKIPTIILQSIDLSTGQELLTAEMPEQAVQNQQDTTETVNKAFVIKQPSERISGFTTLSDGTFVVAVSAATKKGNFSRFMLFNEDSKKAAPKGLKAKKIKRNYTVESLLAIQQDRLIGVVGMEGLMPFELAIIDSKSGQVDSGASTELPQIRPNQRLANLAQSSEGIIYATSSGPEGGPFLVQFDLVNRSPLTGKGRIIKLAHLNFNSRPLENDLVSLAFSPSNQLFALADPQYEGTNSLFTVDPKTGELKLVTKFAVDKIAFKRV